MPCQNMGTSFCLPPFSFLSPAMSFSEKMPEPVEEIEEERSAPSVQEAEARLALQTPSADFRSPWDLRAEMLELQEVHLQPHPLPVSTNPVTGSGGVRHARAPGDRGRSGQALEPQWGCRNLALTHCRKERMVSGKQEVN